MADPLGIPEPRLWTRPLRPLTPETSLGWKCEAFARDVLGESPDPWQSWFMRHALEVKPDGTFRFRSLLLLVSRQNGKTRVLMWIILWLLATGRSTLAVGTAQSLSIAKRSWDEAVDLAMNSDVLRPLLEKPRRANGQEALNFVNGGEYIIKATTADAARGIAGCDLLILDELRTHKDFVAYGALTKVAMAKPNALIFMLSNAGSDDSAVLNAIRAAALEGTSDSLFIAEYSAEDGAETTDVDALRQSNPSLGYGRLSMAALENARATDPPAIFRTECMCQRVSVLDSAVDMNGWRAGLDPGDLSGHRGRITAAVDVSLDGSHVSLYAAADLGEGRVRVEAIGAWRSTDTARDELGDLLDKLAPYSLAWCPDGPAAALAPILKARAGSTELRGANVAAACQGFADLVKSGRVIHSADALLDTQLARASKLNTGDGWRFGRRSGDAGSNVDAVYAAAIAVHVSLTTPPPKRRRMIVL